MALSFDKDNAVNGFGRILQATMGARISAILEGPDKSHRRVEGINRGNAIDADDGATYVLDAAHFTVVRFL